MELTLEDTLEKVILKLRSKKYSNKIDKLVFMNEDLRLSYKVISGNIGLRSIASISNYVLGVNKISSRIERNIDALFLRCISIMENKLKYSINISKSDYKEVSKLILKAKKIDNPHYTPGNNHYKPNDNPVGTLNTFVGGH